jgi:transcriptional regulator with PAS, ATPase and Fis domain
MSSRLIRIQSTVQEAAEAISAALGIEVEIVDSELTVIGGSSRYKGKIGRKEEFGRLEGDFLYARTLRTGQAFVVDDPKGDPRYDPSSLDGTTKELAEICSPISLGGENIGVIGLVAFTVDQNRHLMDNSAAILLFLKHMARLLAAKVSENEAMERLTVVSREFSTILETIHEGALAINELGLVTHCNSTAEQLLKINRCDLLGKPLDQFWAKAPALEALRKGEEYTEKEEIYHSGHKRMHFIVTVRLVSGKEGPAGAVISFRDIAEARRLIYDLSEQTVTYTFDDIIGDSKAIRQVKVQAHRVATSNSTVLVAGESGTGKEVFARAIHHAGLRPGGPFISINCGAIPETLLESELFGYEGGAFTGARKEGKAGKFELADGGTIFLDEIGEMPLHLQVKLLHVLQDREVERVGGAKKIPVDVRIIAASNRDLEMMMQEGKFRNDLYFRLSVIPLHIPPLKERKDDIPALVQHCLEKYRLMLNKRITGVEPEAMESLMAYHWPGNVRELENTVEYAVNMAAGDILTPANLPPRIRQSSATCAPAGQASLKNRVREFERLLLEDCLERYGCTFKAKNDIARELAISKATLYRKLADLGFSQK